ncbi:ATP-grasp domain-containing protein [Hippea sp. KM1]|uniref:ATP-grasp domain-containing protein n=1 Tax=Hippea sp. KM1 TaxID=944481 RepID=UPI00046CB08E|nr:ATP-grasp domain-containing protein [Hippea sp. KM1]
MVTDLKTLLILGTGKDQVFGIEKAKEMGLYTVGLDINEFSGGARLVDEFYKVNIKDEKEVVEFIEKYNNPIDGVIAFGVDIPEILARVAELKGVFYYTDYETALLSKDKYKAKKRMKEYGVRLPNFSKIETFEDLAKKTKDFGYPCVLKPVDNSGARGVLRITEDVDLKWAFEYSKSFSKNGYLILEKFLDGMQISSESFIVDGRVYTVGLSERNYEFLDKFAPFIIENGGDLPPPLNNKQRKEIDEQISRCAEAFGVRNGIIKGDLVIHDGKVFVIEVALRLSGGHFSSVEIPLNTGVDFLRYAIQMSLGEKVNPDNLRYTIKKYVALRYIFPNKKGTIKRLRFPEWFKEKNEVIVYDFYYKIGDKANYPIKSHPERLGFFIIAANNRQEVASTIKKTYEDTVVEIV